MSSLFVIRGTGQGIRHELLKQAVTIGRDSANVLQLNDGEVSRRHAEVRHIDDVDMLVDLGSSNGVFVNGRRVFEQRLENGDQIQIGKTLFLYTKTSDNRPRREKRSVPDVDLRPDNKRESARILHSITQEEGSRFFNPMVEPPEFSWLAKAKSHLQVMYHTTLVVSQTLDIDRLLSRILELIFEWVQVDRGCILLFDADGERLLPRVSRTRNSEWGVGNVECEAKENNNSKLQTPNSLRPSPLVPQRILEHVLANSEGVLTSDAQKDERWEPGGSIVRMGIREAICVPMQGRYGVVGIISIDTTTTPQEAMSLKPNETRHLTTDHLKLMIAIAHQAALAVEDTRYYRGMVQAERLAAVGQTVAVLSHHIKNILQGIRGGSWLIEKGLADANNDMIANGWRIVEKNQHRISDLVLDMLTFSKEREPNLAPADINEVMADVVELMQSRASDLSVKLDWMPGENIPPFLFDTEQIHRAVTNIVTNAIDAARSQPESDDPETGITLREGHVTVCTLLGETEDFNSHPSPLPPPPSVRIIVEDNGPGIPSDMADSLFRPFISHKKGSGGTGLGLAVTHKIFEEHGGRIEVETSSLGGARFVLELPIQQPEKRNTSRNEA